MKKLLALLLLPLTIHAESPSITQRLMDEPATMLDIGMIRLNTMIAGFEKSVGLHWTEDGQYRFFKASIDSAYVADDDKIYVSFLVMSSEPNEAQMAEGCHNAMRQMSYWIMKSVHVLFRHAGDDGQSNPPGYNQGVRELFEFRCYFSSGTDTSEGRFWASRSLSDEKMKIGKWKMRNE